MSIAYVILLLFFNFNLIITVYELMALGKALVKCKVVGKNPQRLDKQSAYWIRFHLLS